MNALYESWRKFHTKVNSIGDAQIKSVSWRYLHSNFGSTKSHENPPHSNEKWSHVLKYDLQEQWANVFAVSIRLRI